MRKIRHPLKKAQISLLRQKCKTLGMTRYETLMQNRMALKNFSSKYYLLFLSCLPVVFSLSISLPLFSTRIPPLTPQSHQTTRPCLHCTFLWNDVECSTDHGQQCNDCAAPTLARYKTWSTRCKQVVNRHWGGWFEMLLTSECNCSHLLYVIAILLLRVACGEKRSSCSITHCCGIRNTRRYGRRWQAPFLIPEFFAGMPVPSFFLSLFPSIIYSCLNMFGAFILYFIKECPHLRHQIWWRWEKCWTWVVQHRNSLFLMVTPQPRVKGSNNWEVASFLYRKSLM